MAQGYEIRELTADDLAQAWTLGRLAFGGTVREVPSHALELTPGVTRWGAFDPSGRLVGKANDVHHEQWWSGVRVVAADVGGVAVAPEARGRGVARDLLRRLLEGARDRGAAVSALYPSVAALYRRYGWALVGEVRTLDIPTTSLPGPRPSPALAVRAGTAADLAATDDLYTRVARERNGMLTRDGAVFEAARTRWRRPECPDALPGRLDGLTLVSEGDELVGYASWIRGGGLGGQGVLEVPDLLATSPAAAGELLGMLGSWRSVVSAVRVRPLALDAVSARLPLEVAVERGGGRWMHRPVDVVRAVEARAWPPERSGGVSFTLEDPVATWNSGTWTLEVADGSARLQPSTATPRLRLSVEGFGLLYGGAATASMLVGTGLVDTDGGADPRPLDLLGGQGRAELLDHF